jgi:hypothetical protein
LDLSRRLHLTLSSRLSITPLQSLCSNTSKSKLLDPSSSISRAVNCRIAMVKKWVM